MGYYFFGFKLLVYSNFSIKVITLMLRPSMSKTAFWAALSLYTCLVSNLSAQNPAALLPCATPEIKNSWLEVFQQRQFKSETRSVLAAKYVAMKIHLVGTDDGLGFLPTNNLLDAICTLNERFAASKIQFFVKGEVNYIRNNGFFNHLSSSIIPGFVQAYNEPGVINVYFVEAALNACGYNYMPRGKSQAVVMANSCMGSHESNWAHEMGHYLSLPHTFYGWEKSVLDYSKPAPHTTNMDVEVEMADQRNCETAGDGFCDTPADYLAGRWQCDINGKSTIKQFDPTGTAFTSDGSLIMSYAAEACSKRFSGEQMLAMKNYLGEELGDHLALEVPCLPMAAPAPLNFPTNRTTVVSANAEVFFAWRKTPEASSYLLEISNFSNFGFIAHRQVISDTSVVVPNLTSTRTYFWRVRPFNVMYTCRNFSEARSFNIIGITTPTPQLKELGEVKVYPNPLSKDQDLQVEMESSEKLPLQVLLLNQLGEVILQRNEIAFPGANRMSIRLPEGLPAGLYALILKGENGAISRKIAIR